MYKVKPYLYSLGMFLPHMIVESKGLSSVCACPQCDESTVPEAKVENQTSKAGHNGLL